MLKKKELRCSIFDSLSRRGNKSRTEPRTVQRYELELYHTDSGTAYIDGIAYPVRRGMLLRALPGQQRYSQLPVRCSYIWLPPESEEGQVLTLLPPCTYLEDPKQIDSLMKAFTQLHILLTGFTSGPETKVARNRQLLEILETCLQETRGSNARPIPRRLIRGAYTYMDENFCENCTLKDIAASVHVTANHLRTVFLNSEGYTPYEYITRKRLEKAKNMILLGENTLAQIALECGFCSQSHFCAIFKKATGQTPAQYKKQLFELK